MIVEVIVEDEEDEEKVCEVLTDERLKNEKQE